MKKIGLLLILLFVFSCKEKGIIPEILIIEENLVGKWNIVKSNGKDLDDCKKKDLYHFKADHSINVKFHHGSGDKCKLAHEIPFEAGLTWDLREEKLFLVYGGPEEAMAHIIEFEDKNTVKFTVWKEDGSIKYTETIVKQLD